MSDLAAVSREPTWADVQLWFATINALVRGLGHALNNRALALGATIESLDPKRPVGQELAVGLARESERLTDQLRQLRALPFTAAGDVMPVLVHDVLASAIQVHRTHASLGEVPVYLEGDAETPPVLVPESAMLHAVLVTLTACKEFAAPGGVVRVSYSGTPVVAAVTFAAHRDPSESGDPDVRSGLLRPVSLAGALLSGSHLTIEQRIGVHSAVTEWRLPSLKAMRRLAREAASAAAAVS